MTTAPQPSLARGPAARPLPYPAFPALAEQVVVDAIITAWHEVQTSAEAVASPRKEVPITKRLQSVLNRYLDDETVPGFTCSVFETIVRGGEVENAADTSNERRPDLTFRLQGKIPVGASREQYGLFTECKLIDERHSVKNYCDSGVLRFVDSEYAWAMSRALIVAYTACPVEFAALSSTLTADAVYRTIGTPAVTPGPALDALESRHDRHVGGSTSLSGPIELQHLWLTLSAIEGK